MSRVRNLEQRVGKKGGREGGLTGATEVEVPTDGVLVAGAGEIGEITVVALYTEVEGRRGREGGSGGGRRRRRVVAADACCCCCCCPTCRRRRGKRRRRG